MAVKKREPRGKSDYTQEKVKKVGKTDKGFVEVEQLTQHDDLSTVGRDDMHAKELPVARRYRIEMVEPQNGSTYTEMGPRPEHPDQHPDLLTFKFGKVYYTPLYLKPEEAFEFMKKFRRAKVPLNVPIHGSKYQEFRTSTRIVHRFKVTAEEKRG